MMIKGLHIIRKTLQAMRDDLDGRPVAYETVTDIMDHTMKRIDALDWKLIKDFDQRMFSIITNGTEDMTEVFKYKGEIPEWATHWKPLDMGAL